LLTGQSVLESECQRVISEAGLEPFVGFLHGFSRYQTKQSLVYDLQEPFRWIADVTVVDAFESGIVDLPDFYFTGDDYRYRFDPEPKQRFLDLLRERFNSGVRYKGRALKWDTVIEQKTNELGHFLVGKQPSIEFVEPAQRLERPDGRELRTKILKLTSSQAKELCIGKSALHYLREKARDHRPFKVYSTTTAKLR